MFPSATERNARKFNGSLEHLVASVYEANVQTKRSREQFPCLYVCSPRGMYVRRYNIWMLVCARIYTRLWTNHRVRSLRVYPSTKATLDETLSPRVASSAVIFNQISSSPLGRDSCSMQSAKFNLSLFFLLEHVRRLEVALLKFSLILWHSRIIRGCVIWNFIHVIYKITILQ